LSAAKAMVAITKPAAAHTNDSTMTNSGGSWAPSIAPVAGCDPDL
jgi:hypothetical protein